MKTDATIQKDVIDELKWCPSVAHEHIGVAVKDGVVTLSGYVPSYIEKSTSEKAAQRVAGVKAIVEKIEVRYPGSYYRGDEDIATMILNAFKWNVQIPEDRIRVKVSKGWVTLSGEVEWEYQKIAAEDAVKPLAGVLGVTNFVDIKPKVQALDVKAKIEEALKRSAEREVNQIHIAVEGSKVTLSGKVRSLSELMDARGAAWSAPGVKDVQDHLIVAA